MEVTKEFLHNVELDITHKVIQYAKHEKEYIVSPRIWVNKRSGRVVMGEDPGWKCYEWSLAFLFCLPYNGRLIADTKYIKKWVKKQVFANATAW